MNRTQQYLDICYDKLTKHKWDNCIAIVGNEGKSKSTLGLHMLEYWYTLLNGEVTKKDIKHICLTREEWARDLRDAQKYEMTIYDEAGDINSRRTMSKFNTSVMEAYQIIRADNIFSILILPSLWDLDRFFRTRRLRGCFYVYQRGAVAFWSESRLKKMLELNAGKAIPNYFRVLPTFYDRFPYYKGVLLDAYEEKKAAKMKGARERLYNSVVEDTKEITNPRDELLLKMREVLGPKKAAEIAGLSYERVRQIHKRQQQQESIGEC